MAIDFESIKSGEPVKIDELQALVEERAVRIRNSGRLGDSLQTQITRDQDGRLMLVKTGSAVSKVAMPTPDQLASLAGARGVVWDSSMVERSFPWWASDERVDRHGDIVRQKWDLSSYEKNPLMLWGHDWGLPPIGASLTEEVVMRTDTEYSGPALHLTAVFAEGWDWAETVFRLVKGGFLRTGSIGMFPGDIVRVQDPDERASLGLGEYGLLYGVTVPNELVEWTIASVPSNIGAHLSTLRSMKNTGTLRHGDIQALRELSRTEIKRGRGDAAAWSERDSQLLQVWRALYPERLVPAHVELDTPVFLQALSEEVRRRDGSVPEVEAKTPSVETKTAPVGEPGAAVLAEIKAMHEVVLGVRDEVVKLAAELDSLKSVQEDVRSMVENRAPAPEGANNGSGQVLEQLLQSSGAAVKLLSRA